MVSNALDRSIYTDPTSFPLLISLRIVSKNSVGTYLVDCLLRNTYWRSVRRFLFSRNIIRLWWTFFSRVFDAIANINIGRWFSGLVESPDLKPGAIFAIFETEGIVDALIDKLIMYARLPAIILEQSLTLIRLGFLKVVFPEEWGVGWGGGGGSIWPPLHISRRTYLISI